MARGKKDTHRTAPPSEERYRRPEVDAMSRRERRQLVMTLPNYRGRRSVVEGMNDSELRETILRYVSKQPASVTA